MNINSYHINKKIYCLVFSAIYLHALAPRTLFFWQCNAGYIAYRAALLGAEGEICLVLYRGCTWNFHCYMLPASLLLLLLNYGGRLSLKKRWEIYNENSGRSAVKIKNNLIMRRSRSNQEGSWLMNFKDHFCTSRTRRENCLTDVL